MKIVVLNLKLWTTMNFRSFGVYLKSKINILLKVKD